MRRVKLKIINLGTSLVVQWLRLCASYAGGLGSVPGQGTKISHAVWYRQKINKKPKNPVNLKLVVYVFVSDS